MLMLMFASLMSCLHVSIPRGGTTLSSGTIDKLAVEQVFGDAAVIHMAHIAVDAEDVPKAAEVEAVQPPFLGSVGGPCLA